MCSLEPDKGFIAHTKRYVTGFFSNLDQPDMSAREKWSKFAKNRYRATVLAKGCCGNHGEPGC